MFARLIRMLLLAAFALPALANGPCHDAPITMTAANGRAMMAGTDVAAAHRMPAMPHHEDRTTVPHVCIGCIPPGSLAMRAIAGPIAAAGVSRRIAAVAFAPASGIAPALPPPRLDA